MFFSMNCSATGGSQSRRPGYRELPRFAPRACDRYVDIGPGAPWRPAMTIIAECSLTGSLSILIILSPRFSPARALANPR